MACIFTSGQRFLCFFLSLFCTVSICGQTGTLDISIDLPAYQNVMNGDTLMLDYACDGNNGIPSIFESDVMVNGACNNEAPQIIVISDVLTTDGCAEQLIQVEVGAQDNCGNTGTLTFFVMTKDDQGPIFVNVQDTIFVSCVEIIPLPTVSDNDCLGAPSVFADNLGVLPVCDVPAIAYERSLFAIDACQNISMFTQVVVVLDTFPPMLLNGRLWSYRAIFWSVSAQNSVKVVRGNIPSPPL